MATKVTTSSGDTYTDYMADTPESLKNENRALLAMMAERGTAGQAEYQRQKEQAKDTRRRSVEMAAARGLQVHAPGTLQAKLAQDNDRVIAGIIGNTDQGMLAHGREMDRIAAANQAWISQGAHGAALNQAMINAQMERDSSIGGSGGGGRGGGGRGGGGGGSDYNYDPVVEAEVGAPDDPSLMEIHDDLIDRGFPTDDITVRNAVEALLERGEISPERAAYLTDTLNQSGSAFYSDSAPHHLGRTTRQMSPGLRNQLTGVGPSSARAAELDAAMASELENNWGLRSPVSGYSNRREATGARASLASTSFNQAAALRAAEAKAFRDALAERTRLATARTNPTRQVGGPY